MVSRKIENLQNRRKKTLIFIIRYIVYWRVFRGRAPFGIQISRGPIMNNELGVFSIFLIIITIAQNSVLY